MTLDQELANLKQAFNNRQSSLQFFVSSNFKEIESLKNNHGLTYKTITSQLDHDYLLFYACIKRARKAISNQSDILIDNTINQNIKNENSNVIIQKKIEKKETNQNFNREDDLHIEKWMKNTVITQQRLIRKLIDNHFSIDEVNSWKCSNNIQINNRLVQELQKRS